MTRLSIAEVTPDYAHPRCMRQIATYASAFATGCRVGRCAEPGAICCITCSGSHNFAYWHSRSIVRIS